MVWDEKRKPRGIALYVCLSAVCLCLSLSVRPKGRGRCKLERGNLQTCSGLSRVPAPSRRSRVAPTSGRSPLPVCSMLSLGLIISFLRSLEAALPHSCQCLTSLQCRTFVVAGLVPPSSSCIPKTLYNRITPPLFRFGDLQTFVRKKNHRSGCAEQKSSSLPLRNGSETRGGAGPFGVMCAPGGGHCHFWPGAGILGAPAQGRHDGTRALQPALQHVGFTPLPSPPLSLAVLSLSFSVSLSLPHSHPSPVHG
jgi:hypothetical protein